MTSSTRDLAGRLGAGAALPGAGAALGTIAIETAVGALALGYGLALDRVLPKRLHILTNPAAAAALCCLARGAGVTAAGQGLAPASIGKGLLAGLRAAAPIAGVVAAAVAAPPTRAWFRDDRLADLRPGQALYEALVRVPAATAMAEEAVFRGAVLGILLRRCRPATAVALSSALFGLWHLLPGMARLNDGPTGRVAAAGLPVPALARAAAPAATVAATAAAGAALAALRLRTGSVMAPAVAHAALNATALLGGWLVNRLDRRQGLRLEPIGVARIGGAVVA